MISTAFFQRNFIQCQRDLKVKCYLTCIRPIIEYVATVWSPHTQCNIHSIEMIQRKAARFVFNDFARLSSVSTMLELLGWDSLEKRRDQLTLMILFKIINHHVVITHSHIQVDFPSFTRSTACICMQEPIPINFPFPTSNQTLAPFTPPCDPIRYF